MENTNLLPAKHKIIVLLIDDQAMIGEAVRRMLMEDSDIEFIFCQDPTKALQMADKISPTVILQDLVMPEIDGLTLVKFFRANEKTKDIPMIVLSTREEPKVKAEAFALGANDYLVKLPDKIELIARIRHHSQGYINYLERNEAYLALEAKQKELAAELDKAAEYVKSLLPEPMDEEIKTAWNFIPSISLGGDSFGYHWLDEDHFAMYLLDVCGHGVGAALLSVSAMNVLRSQSLPNIDFADPSEVLTALNVTFEMEKHNNMYFTMWYGVYHKGRRQIAYSSAGHPPALILAGDDPDSLEMTELMLPGMVVGALPGMTYDTKMVDLKNYNKLLIFSDGVYEIEKGDDDVLDFADFAGIVNQVSRSEGFDLDEIYEKMKELNGSDSFEDDYSIVEFIFSKNRE